MIESTNLKGAAAKGLLWSAIDRFGSQGVQLFFGILVTRILLPEDYGLVGMILIFMVIGQTLIDSGFSSALIWKKNATPIDYSTVFYLSIFISFLIYFIVFLIAPLVSDFYNEPRLTDLIRVLCLNFIFLSFGIIQQIILQKTVDFKVLAYINISGSFVSGIISYYLAYKGFGVWAIILQIIIKSFFTTLLLWIFNKWRPMFAFSWNSFNQLFDFGFKLGLAGLINTIFQYLYFNVIGKLFTPASLGFYTRAVQFQEFPVKTISGIFQRVTFPVFSSIQDDNERLKNAVRKALRTMVFFTFPILFGLIAISDELIVVVLTEKWSSASEYFKLLCVVGLFYSFQAINTEIIKTKGKSGWILKIELITKIILVVNIFITYRWGISAIILGQLATVITAYLISSYYVWKLIGYSIWQQIKDVAIYLLLSGFMFLIATSFNFIHTDPIIKLFAMIVSGSVFYLSAVYLLKLEEINEIKHFCKSVCTKLFS